MSMVGGSKQIPATAPRSTMLIAPCPAHAVYRPPTKGMPTRSKSPMIPIPNSIAAYTRRG